MLNFIFQYWIEILFGILITSFTYFLRMISRYKTKLDATSEGIVVILKLKIMDKYDIYKNKEYLSIEEKEIVVDLYNVYKKFECCDVIEQLVDKIDSIPIK